MSLACCSDEHVARSRARDAGTQTDARSNDGAAPEADQSSRDAASALDAQSTDIIDAGADRSVGGYCTEDSDAGPLTCPPIQRCSPNESAPTKIRVASWNIKVGEVRGLQAVVDVLRDIKPDVVLLQEVDDGVQRSGDVDQARALAAALGYQSTFAPTVTLEGGQYGIAVLARVPFQSVTRLPLTNLYAGEPRTALQTDFCWGRSTVRIINHHADYMLHGAEKSVTELLSTVTASSAIPTLFGGDFNQAPTDRGSAACVEAGLTDVLAEFDPTATFGDRRIDYVYANDQAATLVKSARVLQTSASDHALITVDLALE